ncbi:uncharacterized protein LOC131242445 isoform X5 [Magnolia sinica]|uniref:uncharacterized protein LOC131242445 isoform X5 n=1 Tax=Magnolia sinica TaxID=86752 RepID=UPI0026589F6C|nr:uncharacterized protein LOC131242445 isoform X5 [Magnolia sinica]
MAEQLAMCQNCKGSPKRFLQRMPVWLQKRPLWQTDGTLMLDVFCHRLTAQKAGLRPLMNSSVACNSHRTSIQTTWARDLPHFLDHALKCAGSKYGQHGLDILIFQPFDFMHAIMKTLV